MEIVDKELKVLCERLEEVLKGRRLNVSEELVEVLRGAGAVFDSSDLQKAHIALILMLEKVGDYSSSAIQEKFKDAGIQVDCSPASKWDIRHIAIRAATQVVGFLNEDFNIRKIKHVLLEQFGNDLQHLLYLDLLDSPAEFAANQIEGKDPKDLARALERLIASVNPIPKGQRRGRRSSKKTGAIVCIPGIFEGEEGMMRIHFPKLRIALGYLSLLLAIFQGPDGVIGHPIITRYFNCSPHIFHGFLRLCVETGLEKADQYLHKS